MLLFNLEKAQHLFELDFQRSVATIFVPKDAPIRLFSNGIRHKEHIHFSEERQERDWLSVTSSFMLLPSPNRLYSVRIEGHYTPFQTVRDPSRTKGFPVIFKGFS